MNVSDFTTGDSERRTAEANLVSTETTDAVNAGLVGSADKSGQMLKIGALSRDSDSFASQPLDPSKTLPSDGTGAGLTSALGAADKADAASELTRSAYGFRAARGALLANGVSQALQDTELEGLDGAYYKGKTVTRLGKKLVNKAHGKERAKGAQQEAQNGLGELTEKKYRRPKGNKEIQQDLQRKRNQMTSRAALQANSAKIGTSGAAAVKGGSAAAASGGGGAVAVLGGAALLVLGILIFFLFLGLLGGIIGDDQEDTGSLTGNEAIIAQYLLDQGFSKAAVAGVLGNIANEGDPSSDINMDGRYNYTYERACGMFQYTHASNTTPPYYTCPCEYCRYKKWCSESGKTWSDMHTQLEWTFGGASGSGDWQSRWIMRKSVYLPYWGSHYSWLNTSTLCTASEYKNQSDPGIAAYCWMAGYEGCAYGAAAHLDRRIESAQDYFNKLNTSSGSGQTYANSTGTARSIADWCSRTASTSSGYCAKWVSNVYENATGRRPGGNANDMYFNFCVSSDRSELKVGMIIASGPPAGHTGRYRSGSGGTTAYGHVGIYVGDNKVMHSTGGSVHTDSLDDWITSYTVKDMNTGQIMTAKWGYPSWV